MASGDTLCIFTPAQGIQPASNFATFDLRNGHLVADFDATTGEALIFEDVLPRNYAGGGITVYVRSAATSATSGTIGWLVAFERVGDVQDMDADSFASDQTITAATVSGTSGIPTTSNVAVSNGANIDSLAVGESFRLRVTRDVANDTATGDAELISVELKET